MDKECVRPRETASDRPHSGMTLEYVIRAVKENAEEVEELVLKIGKLRSNPVFFGDSK